jgi:hypothetical protein
VDAAVAAREVRRALKVRKLLKVRHLLPARAHRDRRLHPMADKPRVSPVGAETIAAAAGSIPRA